jgi:HSP20 family protein
MPTLVKPTLFPDVDAMERRLQRVFGGTPLTGFLPTVLPAADVYETKEEYVVELEVPGYREKELTIEVSDHTLTVKGTREETKDETEKAYRLQERLERSFKREFRLPPETDGAHMTAHFEKGVLEVHAPKVVPATTHKVEITG